MINIQFSRSVVWQSTLISHICHSPFSHVDIVTDDGNLLGASNSPSAPVIKGNPGGVAIRPPDYQEFAVQLNASIAVPHTVEQKFWEMAEAQLGKPFDASAISLFTFLSNKVFATRDWREESKWFCAELVIWLLETAGAFPYDLIVAKNRVSPSDALLIINPYMMNSDQFWEASKQDIS